MYGERNLGVNLNPIDEYCNRTGSDKKELYRTLAGVLPSLIDGYVKGLEAERILAGQTMAAKGCEYREILGYQQRNLDGQSALRDFSHQLQLSSSEATLSQTT